MGCLVCAVSKGVVSVSYGIVGSHDYLDELLAPQPPEEVVAGVELTVRLNGRNSSVYGPTNSAICRSCSVPEPSVRPQRVRPLLPTQSTTAHGRPGPRAGRGYIFGMAAAQEIGRGCVSRTSAFSDCRDDRPSMSIVRMGNRSNAGGTTACGDSFLACGRTLHCIKGTPVARCPLERCVRRVDFQAAMTSQIVKGRYLPAPENFVTKYPGGRWALRMERLGLGPELA